MIGSEEALESERCLLAAVMAESSTLLDVSSMVRDVDFMTQAHRNLWSMLIAMKEAGESIADTRRLIQNAKQAGIIRDLGGAAEFARHYIDGGVVGNATIYAAEVKTHSTRRRLAAVAKYFEAGIESAKEPTDFANEIRARIDATIADTGTDFDCVTLHEAAKQQLHLMEHPSESRLGRLLSTGLPCLDEAYGGFRCGGSYVLAARPGQGKSALMKQIANSLDMRGKPALLVSLEMEPHEIATRILSERTEIDGKFFEVDENGRSPLRPEQIEFLREVVDDARLSVLHISAPKGQAATMEAIAAQARLARAKYGIQLLAVDYLQIMQKSSPRQSDYEFVTANSKAFKQLARELGIVVLVLSQLNRENDRGSEPRRPRLSDLRDSGAIEQDADGVIMLHRTTAHGDDFELLIQKWRNDSPGRFNVRLIGKLTKFESAPAHLSPRNYATIHG